MKKIFVILCLSFCAFNLRAAETMELGDWIVAEGTSLDHYLDQLESGRAEFQMKTIQLRLRASYGIEIPLIAKAKIRPEIDFVFEKQRD